MVEEQLIFFPALSSEQPWLENLIVDLFVIASVLSILSNSKLAEIICFQHMVLKKGR